MNDTPIEYADYTWNPFTGCLGGCEYCSARRIAKGRCKSTYLANTNLPGHDEPHHKAHHDDPFYPRFWESRLRDRGLFSETPRRIFVCNMSDLFGIGIPTAWTDRVVDQVRIHRQHTFLFLTKQPQKLPKAPAYFPKNAWVGVTATDATMAYDAMTELSKVTATVKYISFEPLLEAMNGGECEGKRLDGLADAGIGWVIIGAQTKPDLNPDAAWVGEVVEAADAAGIPVFLKKNLWECLYTDAFYIEAFWATETATLRQEFPRLDDR